ncbi:hypothetical protein [Streptomyces sp. NPDC055036]
MSVPEITQGFLLAVVGLAGLAMVGLAVFLPAISGREQGNKAHDDDAERRFRSGIGAYVLVAKPCRHLSYQSGARPGSVGVIVRHPCHNHDDTGVFIHWLTKPDGLVQQDLDALEGARIFGVGCKLDELVYLTPLPAAPAEHRPLAKEH